MEVSLGQSTTYEFAIKVATCRKNVFLCYARGTLLPDVPSALSDSTPASQHCSSDPTFGSSVDMF